MKVADVVRKHMQGKSIYVSDDDLEDAAGALISCLDPSKGDNFESRMKSAVEICILVMTKPAYWYLFRVPVIDCSFQNLLSSLMSDCRKVPSSDPRYPRAMQVVKLFPQVLEYLK